MPRVVETEIGFDRFRRGSVVIMSVPMHGVALGIRIELQLDAPSRRPRWPRAENSQKLVKTPDHEARVDTKLHQILLLPAKIAVVDEEADIEMDVLHSISSLLCDVLLQVTYRLVLQVDPSKIFRLNDRLPFHADGCK